MSKSLMSIYAHDLDVAKFRIAGGYFEVRYLDPDSTKIKQIYAKHTKPYAFQIQTGKLDEETSRKIGAKVFFEGLLVGWDNIFLTDEDKTPLPYTEENFNKIAKAVPGLIRDLNAFCSNIENFKSGDQVTVKEDLGNS